MAGRMPAVIRGKSRERTFDLFRTAIQNPRAGVLPLLLVDSEGPVLPDRTAWQHLRAADGWEKPAQAADDQAFLMVQLMETWFLADRAALRRYFGAQLRESAFRAWPDLESVPKQTVLNVLGQATAECRKPYAKGESFLRSPRPGRSGARGSVLPPRQAAPGSPPTAVDRTLPPPRRRSRPTHSALASLRPPPRGAGAARR